MALNATIEKTLTNSTAVHAVIGAGDLAVEKLRGARAELGARAATIDPKAAPEQVKTLPTKAQAAFGEVVANALTTAVSTYGELADRGKDLVTRVGRQQATADLQDQVKATASHAKATTTTAKKSAAATKTAAKSTTTTARKSAAATKTAAKSTTTTARKNAAKTRTSAKSTTTSAKKTAAATKKAAGATASKVGN